MSQLVRSFSFAVNGLRISFPVETNFRIHISVAVLVVITALLFHLTKNEWVAIIICIGMVLAFELLNTAIEELCDIVHKDEHPGIKKVKDISAAAVMLSSLAAAICGAVIFLPKIIFLIKLLT